MRKSISVIGVLQLFVAQTVWMFAPFAPVATITRLGVKPHDRVSVAIALVTLLSLFLVGLSVWGGARIRQWLTTHKPAGPLALSLVVWAAFSVAVFQGVVSQFPGGLSATRGDGLDDFQRVYLGLWVLLLAYQGKTFWDYARDSVEEKGWRWIIFHCAR